MPGRVVAMAHWRRLDRAGTDRCTLSRADHGWMLSGQASWRDPDGEATLLYALRCGPDWTSLSADITGERAGAQVNLRLQCGPSGWTLNDVPQPEVDGCADLDLSFTPASNLMPLRRLAPDAAAPLPVRAAWLVSSLDRLRLLEQTYTPCGAGEVAYASASFQARLRVHPSGFVTHYPGLWEGWVDD